jgi:surface carbohydrate biosynthesis protein
MDRKRILVLVSFKLRDLPGHALLKVLLEQRGRYEVMLVPQIVPTWEQAWLRRFRPDMVVYPGIWNAADSASTHRMRKLGIAVTVIPAEGNSYTPDSRLAVAGGRSDLTAVDLFFVWNEGIADLVRTHRTVDPARCIVAGGPRFDLYAPRYRSVMMSRKEFCDKYSIDSRAPIVTWATNFGWTIYDSRKKLADPVRRYGAQGYDWDIAARVASDVRSREALAGMMARLAREHPEAVIIVKTHPGEEKDWYRRWMTAAGLKNLRLIGDEYIWDVLNATDLHLHRSCTTAIEAWLLDKPTIELQCAPQERYISEEMLPGGDVAYSYDQLRSQVKYYLAGGTIAPSHTAARPGIIEWFIGEVDGQATARHVEAIHAWFTGRDPRRAALPWTTAEVRFAATRAVKKLVGLEPHHSLSRWLRGVSQDPRGRYFTAEELQQWMLKLREVAGSELRP